ncbi:hypothetical protein Amsp01_094670 [Amycolatopsis sp. NBRC 101858]|nr:hypothetical protein Amsp01_094670 [Amycolatopsis sp. NBRC 101858]
MVVVPPPAAAALEDGAAIDEDGAGALLEADEPVSLLPHAVRVSAAAAVRPIPAIRRLRTRIHSN